MGFQERASRPDGPYVKVVDPDQMGPEEAPTTSSSSRRRCSTNFKGCSFEQPTRIKMGWCDTQLQKGNVAHELGHVLGMNHQMRRPDAVRTFNGKGPFLKVLWDHFPSRTKSYQFEPDEQTYIGSANDGPGDPFEGFAKYDFDSIMHYFVVDDWYKVIDENCGTAARPWGRS